MGTKKEMDATKSVAWLSLKKETQERIINYFSDYDEEEFVVRKSVKKMELYQEVHESLGVKGETGLWLIRHLNVACKSREGAIFDDIREYLDKFYKIISAAEIISQRKRRLAK